MALTETAYADLMESIEQVMTSRNVEDFKAAYPEEEFPGWPDPTYAEWLITGRALMIACMRAEGVASAVLTTGDSGPTLGRATLSFPAMVNPVVIASPLDATFDTTYFHAVVESVSTTSATVRVVQNTAAVVLGISLLTVPQLAASATVHVMVYDAG